VRVPAGNDLTVTPASVVVSQFSKRFTSLQDRFVLCEW
jgi:hypothetical protein